MVRSSRSTFPATVQRCDGLCVLLIDGDESFRTALAGNLSEDGHPVKEFDGPVLLPLSASLAGVEVVIADYRLGGSGLEFADLVHRFHPLLPIIVTTAHWTHHLEAETAQRGYLALLRKPFGYDVLHELLHRLCENSR